VNDQYIIVGYIHKPAALLHYALCCDCEWNLAKNGEESYSDLGLALYTTDPIPPNLKCDNCGLAIA
jgi:hypothetical protein